jgi:cysteinyl-tRNA synthetase
MKKKTALILVGFFCLGIVTFSFHTAAASPAEISTDGIVKNYKLAMIDLIADLHAYAIKEKSSFSFISNNGLGIFAVEDGDTQADADRALQSVNGILMEDYFYGWDMEYNNPPPDEEQHYRSELLQHPREKDLPIFNIDYCSTKEYRDRSYKKNRAAGFIGFAAESRQLDNIPTKICAENNVDCYTLKDVKNYLVLLNPGRFKTKEAYLTSLRNTNYDLLIVDLMYNGDLLSKMDVASLKTKANGGRRLVFAYMSVGEAENYRLYWQGAWNKNSPDWMVEKNKEWEGDFKVKYWTKEWRQILYGSKDAYLDQILDSGFDGAFLDVIDAYEYFNAK